MQGNYFNTTSMLYMPPYSSIIYSENWCMQGTTSLGESSGEIYEPRNNKTPVSIRRKKDSVFPLTC